MTAGSKRDIATGALGKAPATRHHHAATRPPVNFPLALLQAGADERRDLNPPLRALLPELPI